MAQNRRSCQIHENRDCDCDVPTSSEFTAGNIEQEKVAGRDREGGRLDDVGRHQDSVMETTPPSSKIEPVSKPRSSRHSQRKDDHGPWHDIYHIPDETTASNSQAEAGNDGAFSRKVSVDEEVLLKGKGTDRKHDHGPWHDIYHHEGLESGYSEGKIGKTGGNEVKGEDGKD